MKGLGTVGQADPPRDQGLLREKMTAVLEAVGRGFEVNVVNVIMFSSGSRPVYDVELDSVSVVDQIVREFYKFTRRRDPVQRPKELANVSIHHSVTSGTRVRIALLRVSPI